MENIQINKWNILHIVAPFATLIASASILGAKEIRGGYLPSLFIVGSLIFILFGSFAPLLTRETFRQFILFFPAYAAWILAPIAASFSNDAYAGAWGSWWVFLFGAIIQWILFLTFGEDSPKNGRE